MWWAIFKGLNAATGPNFLARDTPSRSLARALREIAMHVGAFSRGARGEPPSQAECVVALANMPYIPADHALH